MALPIRGFLARRFPVQAGEGTRVLLAAASNFLIVGGVFLGRSARDSLFLKNIGIQYLPYMYATSAVVVISCAVVYTGLVDRLERRRFFLVSFLSFASLLVVARLVLAAQMLWFYAVLYVLAQTIWILSTMMLWTFAGDIFDTRQAKRLFPVVAMGGLLSMIACGFVTRPLVRLTGSANLFLVWAALLAAALALLTAGLRRFAQIPARPVTPASAAKPSWVGNLSEGFRHVRSTPLLRAMSGITLTLWVVYVLVDFQFNRVMNQAYPEPDQLTGFLGTFAGLAGFGSLLVQVVLTPWLISALGVGGTIALHPAMLLLATCGMLVSLNYGTAFFAKISDHILMYTVQDSSFQLLYSPVPLDRRGRVRAFLEGYFRPLTMGVAGLILALGSRFLTTREITGFASLAALYWLFNSLKVRRAYVQALVDNLGGENVAQRLQAADALTKLKDPDSLGRLAAAIRRAQPASAALAIQFLERFGQPESHRLLLGLVDHPQPQVRATVVGALGRLKYAELVPYLNGLLQDPDARVRANAAEACIIAEAAVVRPPLERCLEDPVDRVRANAIGVLTQLQEKTPSELLPLLEEMCRAPQMERRSAGAYALSWFPGDIAQPLLLGLLKDRELQPRLRAVRSLGQVGDASSVPALLELMTSMTATRREARQALLAIAGRQPEEAFVQVRDAIQAEPVAVRMSAVYALGRLGRAEGLPHLARVLTEADPGRREGALNAIERLAVRHPLTPEVRRALESCALEELNLLEENLARRRSVLTPGGIPAGNGEAAEAARWLGEALAAENRHIRERIFRAAGLLFDSVRVREVAQGITDADARRRANALEALEYVVSGGMGKRLARLLEVEERPTGRSDRRLPDVLLQLTAHRDPAMRACAVLLAGAADVRECAVAVEERLADDAPMVREVAVEAAWRLRGRQALPRLQSAQHDMDPRVRRAADHVLREAARQRTLVDSPLSAATASLAEENMLLTVEKVLFLKSVPLFASLEGEELASVAEIAEELEVQPDSIIFHAGESGDELYVIVRGRVKVYGQRPEGEVLLAQLAERECFGEMALLDAEPRSASVSALEPCHLLKIHAEDFRELLHERPQISLEILKILARRLRRMDVELESRPVYDSAHQYM